MQWAYEWTEGDCILREVLGQARLFVIDKRPAGFRSLIGTR